MKLLSLILFLVAAALGYLFGTEQGPAHRDAVLEKRRREEDAIDAALDAADSSSSSDGDALDAVQQAAVDD